MGLLVPRLFDNRKGKASAIGLALAMGALAGCRSLPESKPQANFTLEEARGQQVFERNCARCHYPNSTQGLHGPGLRALTKLKELPSGTPSTDERISQTVLHGHGMMQPVPVEDADLQDLLAYLHTL
jgi:mono/diheme cytochrome c family protein